MRPPAGTPPSPPGAGRPGSIGPPNAEDAVLRFLLAWVGEREAVRAAILTSSRANPTARVDRFSDYDVILAVRSIEPFFEDRGWLGEFGEVLVVYRDPIRQDRGCGRFAYITQYADGLKIDFTLCPPELLRRIVTAGELPPELDVGYRVLVDKDGVTRGLPPPTHRAHIPSPPGEAEYLRVIESIFHEATYVAKHLRRGDLVAAKYNLDHAMKHRDLRRMLEWRIELDHGWSIRPGAYGRDLGLHLPPQIWRELVATYAGGGTEENWEALLATLGLLRRTAREVGTRLGYAYPTELDQRVVAYLGWMRESEA